MKLRPLLEVRYAGSLEADPVLYTLWRKRNEIQKDNLSVVKIDDPFLSKKRAAVVARYAVRVITPEALDAIGLTKEAQKLRDLPPDIDLKHTRVAARIASAAASNAIDATNAIVAIESAYYAANAAYTAALSAATCAADAAYYAATAAEAAYAAQYASKVTNKQRHLYHLDQMIKIAADIK